MAIISSSSRPSPVLITVLIAIIVVQSKAQWCYFSSRLSSHRTSSWLHVCFLCHGPCCPDWPYLHLLWKPLFHLHHIGCKYFKWPQNPSISSTLSTVANEGVDKSLHPCSPHFWYIQADMYLTHSKYSTEPVYCEYLFLQIWLSIPQCKITLTTINT